MESFQKLTPHISEVKTVYKEAFDFVFSHDEIKNIAISGAFGAGKSSVFESYMRNYKKGKIIHISLAHFEQLENLGKASKAEDEAKLEKKIINQLIHQINPKSIKKTVFIAQIKNISWKQSLKLLGFLIASLIPFYIIFNEKLQPFISTISPKFLSDFLLLLSSSTGIIILSLIFFIFLYLAIYSLFQHSRGNNLLKSLSVKDFRFELPEKKIESYFDTYLSEIRYLFENSGSTIIAIEDIDRYLSSSIFEKIRELNTIINYDKKNRVIRFFYIIKDDIFTSKDRTKFFDFIIPIVPILDSSNSYSQLLSRLPEKVTNQKLNKKFLRGLSIYIDDMRILKNIINEFFVYQHLLLEEDLDPKKLLAFITYKNIFPKDFNDLQAGTGYLFHLINARDQMTDYVLQTKIERLKALETERKDIDNEVAGNIDELSALFLKPMPNLEKIGNKKITQFETQLDLYREIKLNPSSVIIRTSTGLETKNFTTELANIQKDANFLKRKELIQHKGEREKNKIENEIIKIKESIDIVRNSHLISNLIDADNIDYYLEIPIDNKENKYKDIRDDLHYPIIRFLIKFGMIDGSYEDYFTYFYENEIKIRDQQFVRSVFDEKPLPKDHKLSNPEAVLEIIDGISENNFAYINTNLFFFVFDQRNEEEAGKAIKLLKKELSGDIIRDYLQNKSELGFIITQLNTHWISFFNDVVLGSEWSDDEKLYFLQLLLIYSDQDSILIIEDNNSILQQINKNDKILLDIDDDVAPRVINNLKTIHTKFENLNTLLVSDVLISGIYENNLYQLSIDNIRFWINEVYGISIDVEAGSFFSTIFSKSDEQLNVYVQNNLNEVVSSVIDQYPNLQFNDNQNAIWIILDSPFVEFEYKKSYITQLKPLVKDIRGKKEVRVLIVLINNNKIDFNINNLLTLFKVFNQEFTPEFISYLEIHKKEWVKNKNRDSSLFPDEVNRSFFDAALNNLKLDKMVTETLLDATKLKITAPNNVTESEKARALISSKALSMNSKNLAYIRTNHPNLILEFEKENINAFILLLKAGEIVPVKEIVGLLESNLDGRKQKSLLSKFHEAVPYKQAYHFTGTKRYIIEHRLDLADLEKVISDPISQDKTLFPLTMDLIINNLDQIVSDEIALPHVFFEEVIKKQEFRPDVKFQLLSISMRGYSSKQIRNAIFELEISPFVEMINGKHPKLSIDPVKQRIFQVLSDKGMASRSLLTGRLYKKGDY